MATSSTIATVELGLERDPRSGSLSRVLWPALRTRNPRKDAATATSRQGERGADDRISPQSQSAQCINFRIALQHRKHSQPRSSRALGRQRNLTAVDVIMRGATARKRERTQAKGIPL